MSADCKTRHEVQRLLRSCLLEGTEAMGLSSDGAKWDAMEFGDATFDNADRIVTMNLVGESRAGWQGTSYSATGLTRTDEWADVQRWQMQCVLRRRNGDAPDGPLAEDCASRLVAWFNGMGCEWLRRRGLSCLCVDGGSVMVYNDDSALYQKRAAFSVKVCVPKSWTVRQEFAEVCKPGILPV